MKNILCKDNSTQCKHESLLKMVKSIAENFSDKRSYTYLSLCFLHYLSTINKKSDEIKAMIVSGQISLDEAFTYVKENYIAKDYLDDLLSLLDNFDTEDFKNALCDCNIDLSFKDMTLMPQFIYDLASKILNIKENDCTYEFCQGLGDFSFYSAISNPNSVFHIVDEDPINNFIVKYKSQALGLKDIKIQNQLPADFHNKKGVKIQKIIASPFFSLDMLDDEIKVFNKKFSIPTRRNKIFDFASLFYLSNLLDKEGCAIAFIPSGFLSGKMYQHIRKYMLETNLIKAVINLPKEIFDGVYIEFSMIVLGKNNSNVRLVDARSLGQRVKRKCKLSDESINLILNALNENLDISCDLDIKTLEENDFSLNFANYTREQECPYEGVDFESVIASITRGASHSLIDIDNAVTQNDSCIKYLRLGDIHNGAISKRLLKLSSIDEKHEKYLLEDKDLLLSKNGPIFKAATVGIKNGEKILVGDNFFIIKVKKDIVDPYFLAAFFNSKIGQKALNIKSTGSALAMLSLSNLKKIKIPLIEQSAQQKIALEYANIIQEIKNLEGKLEAKNKELCDLFNAQLR